MSTQVRRGPDGKFAGSYGSQPSPKPEKPKTVAKRPAKKKRSDHIRSLKMTAAVVGGCGAVGVLAGSVPVAWIALAGVGTYFGARAAMRYAKTPRGRAIIARLTRRQPRDVVQEPKPRVERPDPPAIVQARQNQAQVPVPPRRTRDPEQSPATPGQRLWLAELGIPEKAINGLTEAMATRIITRHSQDNIDKAARETGCAHQQAYRLDDGHLACDDCERVIK